MSSGDGSGLLMRSGALPEALSGTLFADRVHCRDVVTSTIDECRALADAGAPEGTVVLALAQEQGRGQRGNRWFSPPHSGLYLSALLRPALPLEGLPGLPLMAGIAACEALREDFAVDAWLKSPNDLLVPLAGTWRKVGGLLVDTAVQGGRLRHVIVSLGLNCRVPRAGYPADVRGLAASLDDAGATTIPDAVAAAFLVRLARARSMMDAPCGAWLADVERRHEALARDAKAGEQVEDA